MLRGPSGHSWFRRTRFALALFSPFGMSLGEQKRNPWGYFVLSLSPRMSVVGTAKDIYLEKFGLDPTMFSMLDPASVLNDDL